MSVGAGSIKRAARTAKAENKAAVITGAEGGVRKEESHRKSNFRKEKYRKKNTGGF